jgi:hypothetical protein
MPCVLVKSKDDGLLRIVIAESFFIDTKRVEAIVLALLFFAFIKQVFLSTLVLVEAPVS